MSQRDKQGRFLPGNKIRQRPIICPVCKTELSIKTYITIKEQSLLKIAEIKPTEHKNMEEK